MARPQTVTDEELHDAAREVFLRFGPQASLAKIARKVGVTPSALIQRAGSKEALLKTALGWRVPAELQEIMSGPHPGAIHPQLVRLLRDAYQSFSGAVPTLIARKLSPTQFRATPLARQARQDVAAWLRRAQQSHGLVTVDPETVADLLLCSMEAKALLTWLLGEAAPVQPHWEQDTVNALWPVQTTPPPRRRP